GLFLFSSTAYRGSSNPEQLGRDLVRLARQLGRSTEAASQLVHILLARLAAHTDGGDNWRDLGEQAGRQRLEQRLMSSHVMMQGQLETEAEAPLAEATRLLAADSVGVVNSLLSVACGAATEDCGLWSWREPLTVARAAAQCPKAGWYGRHRSVTARCSTCPACPASCDSLSSWPPTLTWSPMPSRWTSGSGSLLAAGSSRTSRCS
uniref:DUF222 domain-containing protein n=1 Tax=Macrostomum lignano TaxID=282301 RepID=A0A1I8GT53_9PLAT